MTWAGLRAPLPRGVIDGYSGRVAEASVRALTGRDEELLAELAAPEHGSMAAAATTILVRCLLRMGEVPVTRDAVRSLSVGDREALLLHLRLATLGERIDCVATCPDPACGERLDLTLSVAELLVPPVPEPAAWYEEAFASASGSEVVVRFRVPTGADQEATAVLAGSDPVAAASALLARCVIASPGRGEPPHLPEDVADAVAARMAELDPQAEIRLRFDCPVCGRPVDVLFDTASFFLAEVAATADRLIDEVHGIAWHYHWSEAEILDLPRDRRRRYLDLIAASVGPQNARGVA